MRNAKKLGLVGRCLLAGGLALGGGCAQYNLSPKEPIRFFTCNYWEDLNNNNKTNYPEEFFGIKNKFKKDEKMQLIIHIPVSGIQGKRLGIVISNSKNETVFADSYLITEDYFSSVYGATSNLVDILLKKGGFGKYNSLVFLDNDFVGLHEFEIIE